MIYLDNAATTFPKAPGVAEAVLDCLTRYGANPGRGGHAMARTADAKLYECRELAAGLFNIKNPERVSFCQNTTAALNFAIWGVLASGGHVIISGMEHNSVLRPVAALAGRSGSDVSYSIAAPDKDGRVSPSEIEANLRADTKLICVTHASNLCGTVNNITGIGRLAREKNALFLVDAAQTAGSCPIDAEKSRADLLAFPGHKGLLGPMGAGGLYVREGIELTPLITGGTGSLSESSGQPSFMPDTLESGTAPLPALAGLAAGIKYINKRGIGDIEYHEKRLARALREKLSVIGGVKLLGGGEQTGAVSFVPGEIDVSAFATALDRDHRVACRAGLHCAILAHRSLKTEKSGAVRLSVGPFNTSRDIDFAASAVLKIMKNRK